MELKHIYSTPMIKDIKFLKEVTYDAKMFKELENLRMKIIISLMKPNMRI